MSAIRDRVRMVVVGLGDIARDAVLPAFEHTDDAELVGLISGSPDKRSELASRYDVEVTGDYDDLEGVIERARADAVYLTVPNHLHCEYTVRSARAAAHVICEKPMAVSEEECETMMAACRDADVALMIAYRLHFERTNREVMKIVHSGELGDPRVFDAIFTEQVEEGDIRLAPIAKGGGALYDLGVYCINAAREAFGTEPVEVMASCQMGSDPRFAECDEITSAVLRFPEGRTAAFTTSFNGGHVNTYRVVGSDGEIMVDPAFEYRERLAYEVHARGRRRSRRLEARDQFADEIQHFARSLLYGEPIGPDGAEGLADVRIVRALHESARSGRRISLERGLPPGAAPG